MKPLAVSILALLLALGLMTGTMIGLDQYPPGYLVEQHP